MRHPSADAWVVRVYRRDTASDPRLLVGVAEPVGRDRPMAFRTIDDLWRILVPARKKRRPPMEKIGHVVRTIIAAALLTVAAAAPAHAAATFKLSVFTVVMNGAQVSLPNDSTAIGTGMLTLDEVQRNLCVRLSTTVAGETSAKIYGPAFPQSEAPEIFPLSVGNPKGDCGVLTKDQVKQLKAGLFYVQIQSSTFPGGEIRGQIFPVGKGLFYKIPD